MIDYELPLADALGGPRIHHQHLPDILYYEQGFPSQAAHALQALGHTVQERSGYIGSAPTILRVGSHWEGAPDPRSGGLAKGY